METIADFKAYLGGTDASFTTPMTAQDYYPFGMLMPNRHSSLAPSIGSPDTAYCYGFNGKENDNTIKGMGNQQDYGERIYDTRVGRFLSVDPLSSKYPELTPYQFASNSPIKNIDLDGLEAVDPSTKELLLLSQTMVDMSKAPAKFLTASGRWVYTTTNTLGEKRNNAYYWAQVLAKHPEFFSEQNKLDIERGIAPIVDQTWIKFASTHEPWIGQVLEHHHEDHGNEAYALPWVAHRGKGNYKIWHKTIEELTQTKLKTSTNVLTILPILDPTTWSGYFAGRPSSFFMQIEGAINPQVGKVYENTDDSFPGNYFIIREKSTSGGITTYVTDFYGGLENAYDVDERSFKAQRVYSVDKNGNQVVMQ